MSQTSHSRPAVVIAGAIAVAGSIVFLAGGRSHPQVNSDMGAVGSEEFYRRFIAEIMGSANWEGIHVLILAGPILWAIAASGFGGTVDEARRPFWQIATQMLGISAALWAATFVLDGFVTPLHARELAGTGELQPVPSWGSGATRNRWRASER